ncbi:MAG: nucleotidyltransferase family protein [Pseudomonadota bacterium]
MSQDRLSAIWAHQDIRPEFSPLEWEIVIGQAMQAGLMAKFAHYLLEKDWLSQVPPQPRQYLEGNLRLSDRQHHEVHWEVDCIRRALKDVDSPIVLLKGAAYLIAGLPSGRGRLFSDIDIMVRHESLHEVEAALFTHGWISEERDAYNDRYYRQWMHEIPPMKHIQRNTVIDVHHTITPPTSRFRVDATKLFTDIVAVDEAHKLFILAPVDMVLHSAAHLFQEGEFNHGMRDLLDLRDLLLHFAKDPVFFPSLFRRAKELGLEVPLFHGLHHIHRLFKTDIPPDLACELKDIQPNLFTRWLMSNLLAQALQPKHPSCQGIINDVSRWLLYVRSHFIRMPWYLVVPHLFRKATMRYLPEKEQ